MYVLWNDVLDWERDIKNETSISILIEGRECGSASTKVVCGVFCRTEFCENP